MAYIGNRLADAYTSFAKQDFTTSATTSYTLDNPVANANEIALFINFVRQEPTTAYTASGTSLTLTSATSASDDMYCVFLGKAVQTVNPPSGSVGLDQLSATGTKDATTFLRGDNTFASAGGTNTPLFQAKLSSNTVISDATTTLIPADTEQLDTDNCYNNTGSTVILNGISTPAYAFAPNVAGKYYIEAQSTGYGGSISGLTIISTFIYKNGSAVKSSGINLTSNSGYVMSSNVAVIVEMNGTSDYVQAYSYIDGNTQARLQANDFCTFGGYKIIE